MCKQVREISFAGDVKSFLEERTKATEFGFNIENKSADDIRLIITAAPQSLYPKTEEYIKELSGADYFLTDGTIKPNVTATTINSRRSIDRLLESAMSAPFRFTKFVMTSYLSNGKKDFSNYNNIIKSGHISPLIDTVEDEFTLRNLISPKNYQQNLLTVDFPKYAPNLPTIISNENYMVIEVNAGTTLSINAFVGATLSQPQKLYRILNKIDKQII